MCLPNASACEVGQALLLVVLTQRKANLSATTCTNLPQLLEQEKENAHPITMFKRFNDEISSNFPLVVPTQFKVDLSSTLNTILMFSYTNFSIKKKTKKNEHTEETLKNLIKYEHHKKNKRP